MIISVLLDCRRIDVLMQSLIARVISISAPLMLIHELLNHVSVVRSMSSRRPLRHLVQILSARNFLVGNRHRLLLVLRLITRDAVVLSRGRRVDVLLNIRIRCVKEHFSADLASVTHLRRSVMMRLHCYRTDVARTYSMILPF